MAHVQARDLLRKQGVRIDRTERVANALGHLLGVLQKLSALKDSGVKVSPQADDGSHSMSRPNQTAPDLSKALDTLVEESLAYAHDHACGRHGMVLQMALFAGRRSTDRTFLLLQNLLCAKHLPNYLGTSSVYAITLVDRTARRLGMSSPDQRHALTGALQQRCIARSGPRALVFVCTYIPLCI